MVGIVKVDTLQNNAGTSSVGMDYVVNGSAKAWVNFNGTASGATARDSFNNSSMADNGTGNYDINLANAMSDTNQVTCVSNAEQAPISSYRNTHIQSILETASLVNVNNYDASQRDIAFNQVAVHGDLA
jgi:hypothetical protein